MGNDIDPIEFGKVLARLEDQDRQIAEIRTENREMRDDIKRLLAMANQGKGGLFTLTSIGAVVGAVVTEVARHFIFSGR
ncbi:hypothetical protein [Paraburkholderia rhynchosiae]|uniref:Uncharacterized protein n=1 Tax=Paraburkholderia rhynchosiae TaxID=487049 RepID=A0A2N7W9C8_9BURK|nr:hypothetical protein [Paraburkholderia rhynchosiae]PMS26016.1 hypothetical protein C0Z16_28185 [Paraburkholderia rhynchosiae]CAB3731231.1 hypothetical protein LMG27174_05817 [Paraburkholderia rhynchosiae]